MISETSSSDYLPSISFYWPMVAARDCPTETIALHELEAAFTSTEKHVHIVSCVDRNSAQFAIEMAGVIAGSKERIKARPPLSLIASPISPLNHDAGVLEAALAKTKWILKNHKPRPLDEKAADELKRIINTAETELLK